MLRCSAILKNGAHLFIAASISCKVKEDAHSILIALLQNPFSISAILGKVANIVP
jgi:hypothetical protein